MQLCGFTGFDYRWQLSWVALSLIVKLVENRLIEYGNSAVSQTKLVMTTIVLISQKCITFSGKVVSSIIIGGKFRLYSLYFGEALQCLFSNFRIEYRAVGPLS